MPSPRVQGERGRGREGGEGGREEGGREGGRREGGREGGERGRGETTPLETTHIIPSPRKPLRNSFFGSE